MQSILAGVLVLGLGLGLAGCGLRYTGTEQQMQQVARSAAEMLKKDPYSDTVAAVGTGAHLAMSTLLAEPAEVVPARPVYGAFADEARQVRAQIKQKQESQKEWGVYGPLPNQTD